VLFSRRINGISLSVIKNGLLGVIEKSLLLGVLAKEEG